jgi:ABC-2 type transport system permease protein
MTELTAQRAPTHRMLGAEVHKGLSLLWASKLTLIPEVGAVALVYLALQFFIGDGRIVSALLPTTLLAFAGYTFLNVTTVAMSSSILADRNGGTLEQLHLSPLPVSLLALGRLAAAVVEAVLVLVPVAAVLIVVFHIHIPVPAAALVPAVLAAADIIGFALLIGGLAVLLPAIGSILHVINSVIFLLNGSLVPVTSYPAWLEPVADVLPSTLGATVLRKVSLQGESLAGVWADHSLPLLLGHTVAMVAVGWAVYVLGIRRGLRTGRLGP